MSVVTQYIVPRRDLDDLYTGAGSGSSSIIAVQAPLQLNAGVLSIPKVSHDTDGYLSWSETTIGAAKSVGGLTLEIIDPINDPYTQQGLVLYGEGNSVTQPASWFMLRWDPVGLAYKLSTDSLISPLRAITIGTGIGVLGDAVSLCSSPYFNNIIPITGVAGTLTYDAPTGVLTGAGGGAPALTATYIGYGSGGNVLTGSAQYIVDDADPLVSKLKVVSPNGLKLTQISTDQGFDISQIYSTASTLELHAGGLKCLSVAPTWLTTEYPVVVKGASNQLTLQSGAVTYIESVDGSGNVTLTGSGSTITTTNRFIVTNTTASTTKATGAVTISGGLGVSGEIYGNVLRGLTTAGSQIQALYSAAVYGTLSCSNLGYLTISATGNRVVIPSTARLYLDNTLGASATAGALISAGGLKALNAFLVNTAGEQLTLSYDANNWGKFTQYGSGYLTLDTNADNKLQVNCPIYNLSTTNPTMQILNTDFSANFYVRLANPVSTDCMLEASTATLSLRAANLATSQVSISSTSVSLTKPLNISGTAIAPQITLDPGGPVSATLLVNGSGELAINCSGVKVTTSSVLDVTNTTEGTTSGGSIQTAGGIKVQKNVYLQAGNVVVDPANTIWDEVQLFGSLRTSGAPTSAVLATVGDFTCIEFISGATRYTNTTHNVRHSWMEGTALKFHVHWSTPTTDAGQNVQWRLTYAAVDIDAVFSTTGTQLATVTKTGVVANTMYMTDLNDVPMTGKLFGNNVLLKLERLGASDTYTGSAYVWGFSVHYRVGSLGSTSL